MKVSRLLFKKRKKRTFSNIWYHSLTVQVRVSSLKSPTIFCQGHPTWTGVFPKLLKNNARFELLRFCVCLFICGDTKANVSLQPSSALSQMKVEASTKVQLSLTGKCFNRDCIISIEWTKCFPDVLHEAPSWDNWYVQQIWWIQYWIYFTKNQKSRSQKRHKPGDQKSQKHLWEIKMFIQNPVLIQVASTSH